MSAPDDELMAEKKISSTSATSIGSEGKYGEPDEDTIHRSSLQVPVRRYPSNDPNHPIEVTANPNLDGDDIIVDRVPPPPPPPPPPPTPEPRPIKKKKTSLAQRVVNTLPFKSRKKSKTEQQTQQHNNEDMEIHLHSTRTRVSFAPHEQFYPGDTDEELFYEKSVEMELFKTSLIESLTKTDSFFVNLSAKSDGDVSNSSNSSPNKHSGIRPSNTNHGKIGTYDAVSSYIQAFEAIGGRSVDFIPKPELNKIVLAFEEQGIDLSDVSDFPYDAKDLSKCIRLLARIQNSVAMEGVRGGVCTVRHITEDVLIDRSKKAHRYDIGEWVEVRGPSMRWRLEIIEDILKSKDEDGNTIYWYETAVDHKLAEHEVRLPREALRRVFGVGPWVWLQWAALRLENKLRFQEGHQDDFELLNIPQLANELWKSWLYDSRNKNFRMLFERIGKSGQEELLFHMMSPFKLMEEIITNSSDKWNLEDAGISIFTYVSLLGSGFVDAFIIFLLQLAFPIILLIYYSSPGRGDDGISPGTRSMLFVILFYYVFKVTRDMISQLKSTVGISDTVYSRILRLRTRVWDLGNDSFPQSIGFVGDLFMNTGYLCYLYLFNMFILYNIGDTFEMVGSVIIFEFVFNLDEELAATRWLDDKKRFLRAGIIEILFQICIRREHFESRKCYLDQWCKLYSDDERKSIERLMDGAGIPHNRDFLKGTEPDADIGILTVGEIIDRLRREDSQRISHLFSDEEDDYFAKPEAHFGSFWDSDTAVFTTHKNCTAWSQWEKIIFMFPTPNLVPANYKPGSKLVFDDVVGDMEARRGEGYSPGRTKEQRFWIHVWDVLSFKYTMAGFRNAFNYERRQRRSHITTRIMHAIFAWNSYVTVLFVFPVLSLLALILVWTDVYCTFNLGPVCEKQF